MFKSELRNLGGIRIHIVTLASPSTGNALGKEAARELAKLLKTKCDALLLTNEGTRFFCTGGNLKEQSESTGAASLKTQKELRVVLGAVSELAIPTLALVKGDAFGGGVEALSACDFVMALPHIRLGVWQRKLGVTFGWGGGSRLLGRIGSQRLRNYFVSAKTVSAYEAERIGLVDEVALEALADARALQWLVQAAKLPPTPLTSFRTWDSRSETRIFEKLWFKKDHLAAIKTFLPTREPRR